MVQRDNFQRSRFCYRNCPPRASASNERSAESLSLECLIEGPGSARTIKDGTQAQSTDLWRSMSALPKSVSTLVTLMAPFCFVNQSASSGAESFRLRPDNDLISTSGSAKIPRYPAPPLPTGHPPTNVCASNIPIGHGNPLLRTVCLD